MLSPKSECVGWGHRAEMSKPPKASPAGPPPSGCARLRHPPERASEPREGLGTEKGKVAFWLLKGFLIETFGEHSKMSKKKKSTLNC